LFRRRRELQNVTSLQEVETDVQPQGTRGTLSIYRLAFEQKIIDSAKCVRASAYRGCLGYCVHLEDAAADGHVAGEGALLVDVGALPRRLGGLEPEADVLHETHALALR